MIKAPVNNSIHLKMKLLWFSAILLFSLQPCTGGKILVFTAMPSRSHHNVVERYAIELAKKGHEITYLTQIEITKPVPNLKQIILPSIHKEFSASLSKDGKGNMFDLRERPKWLYLFIFAGIGENLMNLVLSLPEMQNFINSNQTFDLIVCELFLDEGMIAGLSYKFKAPVVALQASLPNFWPNYLVGNPSPLSYIPERYLGYPTKMTFWQRLGNFLFGIADEIIHRTSYIPTQDKVMRKYFGNDLPPLDEIVKNTSMILVTHHHSLAFPRPYLPNMVEIGGYHINPVKPLPEDLQKYLDDSKNGAILFSMGSNLKSSNMPNEMKRGILKAFSRLKQKVLWKFEDDSLTEVPENVKISKWLPQSDILAHPNVKLFITHGGLLSTTEAVYRGVPVLGIPIFSDQPANIKYCELAGLALKLDFDEISEETLYDSITEIVNNPKYKESAMRVSAIFKDTPLPAMDTAIYWIEYVMRHKGATHLRSASQDLAMYQLYLWDVMGVLFLAVFLMVYISCKVTKFVLNRIFSKKTAKVSKSKKRN